MSLESLNNKLKNCENILGTMIFTSFNITIPERYRNRGFDFILYDAEHGPFTAEALQDIFYVARLVDMPTILRVTDSRYAYISKALDMGADGVLIPRVETLAQVKEIVDAFRFYPRGKKGCGGRGLFRKDENSTVQINDRRILFLQIESPLGADNLDEILTTYGEEVGGILIGPTDTAIMCGCDLDLGHEKVIACIRKTIAVCKQHHKSVGMFMGAGEVKRWHEEGMNVFWVGTELGAMDSGIAKIHDTVQEALK